MSEIEKLYENAGVKPTYYDACTVEDKYWQDEKLANKYGTFDMYMNAKCGQQENCTTLCSCAYTKENYPPFTAEKQLELIKWLAKNKNDFGLTFYDFEKEPQWESCCEYCWEEFNDTCKNIDFEQSLAGLINFLWKSLTDVEKEQIKEILNGY